MRSTIMRRVKHLDDSGEAFCQSEWRKDRRTKKPILVFQEYDVTCQKCLDKIGKQPVPTGDMFRT